MKRVSVKSEYLDFVGCLVLIIQIDCVRDNSKWRMEIKVKFQWKNKNAKDGVDNECRRYDEQSYYVATMLHDNRRGNTDEHLRHDEAPRVDIEAIEYGKQITTIGSYVLIVFQIEVKRQVVEKGSVNIQENVLKMNGRGEIWFQKFFVINGRKTGQ